jgi:hypothetical protein
MVRESELLNLNTVCIEATACLTEFLSVRDELGVEQGVVKEEVSPRQGTNCYALYDLAATRLLTVEKARHTHGRRSDTAAVTDGAEQRVTDLVGRWGWLRDDAGRPIGRLKQVAGKPGLLLWELQDAAKAVVGCIVLGRCPNPGDLGVSLSLTLSGDLSRNLRLVALASTIDLAQSFSDGPSIALKSLRCLPFPGPHSHTGRDMAPVDRLVGRPAR